MTMNLPAYSQTSLMLLLAVFPVDANENAPVAVACAQDTYALCAYSNCTINGDLKTASCPCYELSGPSMARVDVIPNPVVKEATINKCTDPEACSQSNAPICDVIADGSLWPGADAVSTFSRALEIPNGVAVDSDGKRGEPNWSCSAKPGRLVPNCMLAPCVLKDSPVTNPYFYGNATMECTCPLIEANVDYVSFGGRQSPCSDSPVPIECGYVQNTGGSVLAAHASNSAGVSSAWEAVAEEFERVVMDRESNARDAEVTTVMTMYGQREQHQERRGLSHSCTTTDHTDDHGSNGATSYALFTAFALPFAALLV